MKKSKTYMFSLISKGQFAFILVCLILVMSTTIVFDSISTANQNKIDESLNFSVVIDAGHGGIDPGSIGYKTKVKESELNLSVAKLVEKKLANFGIRTIMTRTDASGLYGLSTTNYKKRDMQKRREIIEKINPDIVVSIHMNSYVRHNLRGAQVFYDKTSQISQELASSIQEQFQSRLEKSTKGISVGDYYMLKCTKSASVITECGFLSNEEDEKLLINEEYQEKIADCIFIGIINYLNLE